ncbi:MAG: ABC transporter permease [Chloroflexota bacterium]
MKASSVILLYDSARRGPPALDELRELYRYRNLIGQLVRRDITTRYKRSALGIAWTMLNPLGMMLIWTLAFSQVFGKMGGMVGYPAYVLNGLLAWTFFSQTTTAAMVNFVWGGNLLNRIYIPRSSFALSAVGTGIVNILLSLIPLLLVMLFVGLPVRLEAIWFVPLAIFLLACFALGLGLLLSTLAVFFPDVAEMYQIVLQAWMFLTPIMYSEEILPEAWRFWLTNLNPMYHLVKLFRIPLYGGRLPNAAELLIPVGLSVVMLLVGWFAFTSKSDEFAYRL